MSIIRKHRATINNHRLLLIVSAACLTFMCIAAVRVPFLSNLLIDEEGIFGYLVINTKEIVSFGKGEAIILSRLDGEDIYGGAEHPLLPYLILNKLLRPIFSEGNSYSDLSFAAKSRMGRKPFIFSFLVGLAALFFVWLRVFNSKRRPEALVACFLILYVSTTPLLVGGSIQPQVDGSIGVMVLGVAALLIILGAGLRAPQSALILIAGGVTASIGKNEWTLALLASVLVTGAINTVSLINGRNSVTDSKKSLRFLLMIVFGAILGSLFSYYASPENFLGGISVMHRLSSNESVSLGQVFLHNITWTWPVFLLIVVCTWLIFQNKNSVAHKTEVTLLYLWGILLCAGYLFVPWGGDGFPRYYIPSAFILLFFATTVLGHVTLGEHFSRVIIAGTIIGIVFNLTYLNARYMNRESISSGPGTSLDNKLQEYRKHYESFRETNRYVISDAAIGYYYRDIDFVGQALGERGINYVLQLHRSKDRSN